MERKMLIPVAVLVSLAAVSVAASLLVIPVNDSPGGERTFTPAMVTEVSVDVAAGGPGKAVVTARGYNPNPCYMIGKSETGTLHNGDFEIVIYRTMRQDAGPECIQVVSYFEHNVTIDVSDHDPGTYTVNVNSVSAAFEIS